MNVRAAAAAGLSPDAATVAFLTNVTGSDQLWTVPARGGWPEQITFFPDAVAAAAWSPAADRIALAKDTGGDENYELFVVRADGAELVPLAGKEGVRHNLGPWSKQGRSLAYSSNERNRRYFDLYVRELDAPATRRVLEEDAFLLPGPFSDDGRHLIAARVNASLDNDLLLVDLAGPAPAVHLTPHEGVARYDPIGWSADGRSLWVLSDAGREFLALGRLDIDSRKMRWVREPSWDIESAALSPDARRLAFVTNEDGYDVVRLLDAARESEVKLPELPRGQAEDLHFSRDGRVLVLTLIPAERPGDVWRIDLASGTASQVTRSSTAGIPPSEFVAPSLVRYKSFDGLEIPAFLYVPGGSRRTAGAPCIVYPHGGPESQTTAKFHRLMQYFVGSGYAVWAPNVRGSTGYGRTFTHLDDVRKREDSVKDLMAGVEWLKASGRVDPRRIAVLGGSYGGYMTLAAITLYPDQWAAAVDLFGIANFRTFLGTTASYRARLRASEYGDPEKDAEFLDSVSPIFKAERIRTPLLVLQGANDPRVPASESEQIVETVRRRGGVAEYILFPDEGHGFAKLANQITAYRAAVDFLNRHLGPGNPQPR